MVCAGHAACASTGLLERWGRLVPLSQKLTMAVPVAWLLDIDGEVTPLNHSVPRPISMAIHHLRHLPTRTTEVTRHGMG